MKWKARTFFMRAHERNYSYEGSPDRRGKTNEGMSAVEEYRSQTHTARWWNAIFPQGWKKRPRRDVYSRGDSHLFSPGCVTPQQLVLSGWSKHTLPTALTAQATVWPAVVKGKHRVLHSMTGLKGVCLHVHPSVMRQRQRETCIVFVSSWMKAERYKSC